jgi:hypothetical protein
MTKYAENEATENAKKAYEQAKNAPQVRVAAAQQEMMKGKATPTQEELDMANLGAHIIEHDDDGSGPEDQFQTRQLEADKRPSKQPAGYQTKAVTGSAAGKAE